MWILAGRIIYSLVITASAKGVPLRRCLSRVSVLPSASTVICHCEWRVADLFLVHDDLRIITAAHDHRQRIGDILTGNVRVPS